jgi:hypothetical protein
MPSTKALCDKLMQQARALFPQWPEAELEKWVLARLYAAGCLGELTARRKQHFGKLLPLHAPQATPTIQQFAPRTTREAGLA